MTKFCKEYLAQQNSKKIILFAPGNYNSINYALKSYVKNFQPYKIQKKIPFAPENYHSINYALKIDGGRQEDRQTERWTDRQPKSLIEELGS